MGMATFSWFVKRRPVRPTSPLGLGLQPAESGWSEGGPRVVSTCHPCAKGLTKGLFSDGREALNLHGRCFEVREVGSFLDAPDLKQSQKQIDHPHSHAVDWLPT